MWTPRRLLLVVLVLALGLRLYGLDHPLLERATSREIANATVARYLHHHPLDLFHPRTDLTDPPADWFHPFPLYTGIVAGLYDLFGVHEFLGRIASLIAAAISFLLLYDLVRRLEDEPIAVASVAVFAFSPLNLYYGRTYTRDSLAMALCIGAVWAYVRFRDRPEWRSFLACALCGAAACLVHYPYLHIGLPLLWLTLRGRGARALLDVRVWTLAFCICAPLAAWLWYAHRSTAGPTGSIGIGTIRRYDDPLYYLEWCSPQALSSFAQVVGHWMLAWSGILLTLAGSLWRRPGSRLWGVWLGAALLYLATDPFVLKTATSGHDYYLLVVLPPLAVLTGRGFVRVLAWPGGRFLLAGLCIVSAVSAVPVLKMQYGVATDVEEAAHWVRDHTAPGDRLLVSYFSGGLVYYADRHGYMCTGEGDGAAASAQGFLESLGNIPERTAEGDVFERALRAAPMNGYRYLVLLEVRSFHSPREWRAAAERSVPPDRGGNPLVLRIDESRSATLYDLGPR